MALYLYGCMPGTRTAMVSSGRLQHRLMPSRSITHIISMTTRVSQEEKPAEELFGKIRSRVDLSLLASTGLLLRLFLYRLLAEDFAGRHEPERILVSKSARVRRGHMALEEAYSPPCQLPSPRIHSAWTLVIRRRFSVSARLAESWESCDCS